MHIIFTYYISNERESISLSNDTTIFMIKVSKEKCRIQNFFFHFFFLNKDISLNFSSNNNYLNLLQMSRTFIWRDPCLSFFI